MGREGYFQICSTLQDFKSFLQAKADLLATREARVMPDGMLQPSTSNGVARYSTPPARGPSKVAHSFVKCPNCKESHYINQCPRFLSLDTHSRIKTIKRIGLCINCLRDNHSVSNCRASTCRYCRNKHHTLLHLNQENTTMHSNYNQAVVNTTLNVKPSFSKQSIQSNNQTVVDATLS